MPNFHIGNVDVHSEDDFRKWLNKAGKTITCSWFIGAIRRRSDGKFRPIIMFADETNEEFCHAFELTGGGAEIETMINRLRAVSDRCAALNEQEEEEKPQ